MIHIGLFEGIGGFSIAAKCMGWKTYAMCEINPFGQRVLKYHFPDAYLHSDIKTLTYETINFELTKRFGRQWRNDDIILTGGFPCQPYSIAGKRKGTADDRHLWPEMLRTIREIQPTWVVGENVSGLVNWNGGVVFEQVQIDLENEGYEVVPFLLPACGINAPHKRERVWFVAYNNSFRFSNRCEQSKPDEQEQYIGLPTSKESPNAKIGRLERFGEIRNPKETKRKIGAVCINERNSILPANSNGGRQSSEKYRQEEPGQPSKTSSGNNWENFPTVSPLCNGNDEFSLGLVDITFSKWRNEGIKSLGNAVVPELVYKIFQAIQKTKRLNKC